MENRKIAYNSHTYDAKRAAIYIGPIYIAAILIVIFGMMPLHQPVIGVIILILISTVPFLYQEKVKNLFMRNVLLEFDDEVFLVKGYNKKDVLAKESSFNWNDIKSYKCYFSQTDITFLTIYLRDGSSKTFPFKDGKNQDQAMNEKSVFSIFFYFVSQYNLDNRPECQISFNKGFFNTKAGTYTLYLLSGLAIVAIILNIVFKPKASIFLVFMSVFIIFGLIMKRAGDNAFYNKIVSKLNPRSPFD